MIKKPNKKARKKREYLRNVEGFKQGWKDMLEGNVSSYESLPRLVETKDIRFSLITELVKSKVDVEKAHYDSNAKMVTIYFIDNVEKEDAVVHYLTDNFALIYDSGDMQFIGIQIET